MTTAPLLSGGRVILAPADLKALVCETTARTARCTFRSKLRACVLTGSLARNESAVRIENGVAQFFGDVDFLLFLHPGVPCGRDRFALLESVIEQELAARGVNCRVSLHPFDVDYLRKIEPHVFAYELKRWGTVVWGDGAILEEMRRFEASEIPMEDGWRSMANRMIETLETAAASSAETGKISAELVYSTSKLYLEMCASAVLLAGAYAPSFRERAVRLETLVRNGGLPVFRGTAADDFLGSVNLCTALKLGELAASAIDGWNLIDRAAADARSLWTHQLRLLSGGTAQDSVDVLMKRLSGRQSFRSRLRGWSVVVRNSGWRARSMGAMRWLSACAEVSPRHAVYAAGSTLFFHLPEFLKQGTSSAVDLDGLRRRLPVPGKPPTGWADVARQIAHNYHAFLEHTRS